jgi:putative transposase
VGKKSGKCPVDRGKIGSKRSVICDGRGLPLAVSVHPSNQHDSKTLEETLLHFSLAVPEGSRINLLADKGYDSDPLRKTLRTLGITPKIPHRHKKRGRPVKLGERWPVERVFSWLNQPRKIKTRYEKKADNYLSLLQLACSMIALRIAGVLG